MILEPENLPDDLKGESFNVVYMDMELGIGEQVRDNPDGSYTVFLNSRYSYERWAESMDHAFNHVRDRDFEKHDVQQIELHAHQIPVDETALKEAMWERRRKEAHRKAVKAHRAYLNYVKQLEIRKKILGY